MRYFLTVGMIGGFLYVWCNKIASHSISSSVSISISIILGSGIFVGLLGVAYFGDIHSIEYFLIIQIFVGVFEVIITNV